jgi:hypothetical protein
VNGSWSWARPTATQYRADAQDTLPTGPSTGGPETRWTVHLDPFNRAANICDRWCRENVPTTTQLTRELHVTAVRLASGTLGAASLAQRVPFQRSTSGR